MRSVALIREWIEGDHTWRGKLSTPVFYGGRQSKFLQKQWNAWVLILSMSLKDMCTWRNWFAWLI